MSEYLISAVSPKDHYTNEAVERLLLKEGIRRDKNLDYTCGMLDNDANVIATGSCCGNTLRCMAVDSAHQGEALMNDIVSHLIDYQFARGNFHLFLYTKCSSAKFFANLGFSEIARVEGQIVFMENRKDGFRNYLAALQKETAEYKASHAENQQSAKPESAADTADSSGAANFSNTRPAGVPADSIRKNKISALVMNANPFTLGHQYLAETASRESNLVHLFIVSEDRSLIPFAVRKELVRKGTAHLDNIIYHDSGSYIISSATFPSYFQKDSEAVIESQARLDLLIFAEIAKSLGISTRYVGDEPTSIVTSLYNRIMSDELPRHNIACRIIPRKETNGKAISASTVRQALKDGRPELLADLVPESTLTYFKSPEASPIIARIQNETEVKHY